MTIITDLLRMTTSKKVDKTDINQLIISALKKDTKQSTYAIAKKCNISWSTAISHLYQLKTDFPELNIRCEHTETKRRKMTLWYKL